MLIGDSIRQSYQELVKQNLYGRANVLFPGENCRFSKFVLWGMHAWMEELGNPKIDVIHWNSGIWDLHRITADGLPFTPIDEYARYTERLYIQMNSYTDRLIWATSIPCSHNHDLRSDWSPAILGDANGQPFTWESWNADVEKYNKIAVEILHSKGNVVINDLYSLVLPHLDKYICEDGVHPTQTGAIVLANQVVQHILSIL